MRAYCTGQRAPLNALWFGKELGNRGDVCAADSLCGTAVQYNIVKQLYSNKIFFKIKDNWKKKLSLCQSGIF